MFGKKLRAARMLRGKTQQCMADSIDIALRTYQCYEQGTRQPSLEMLVRLADELEVSTDYLLCRKGGERMTIDEFDEVFNRVKMEILSEPAEIVMDRFGTGTATLEEALALCIQESRAYAEKLVYRLLAELFVDY